MALDPTTAANIQSGIDAAKAQASAVQDKINAAKTTTPATTVPGGTVPPTTIATVGTSGPNAASSTSAQTPGKDVFGNPIANTGVATQRTSQGTYTGTDGKQYYNYDGTPVSATADSSSSTGTSATPTNADGSTDYQSELDQTNADYQAKAKQVTDTIDNIANGTVPLSPGEQAQVDGLKQQFQQLIQQQTLENTGATGTANIRGYQQGAAEYDPNFQTNIIGSVVSSGLAKISDLNIKMASAVASLTDSFKTNDINEIKASWDIYQSAAKDRAASLQTTIDNTQKAITDARDYAAKQAQQLVDNTIASDKFTYQQKQDAIDNAYKQGQLTEQERHDKATELAAMQAAGGGTGVGGTMPSVTMNADETPNSDEQAAFLASLPPLVQTQVKGLADYSFNPSSFSTSAKQSQGNLTQGQLIALAKQYDPTYSESQYATRQSYLKNVQSGQVYQGIISANKAINHLAAFTDSMSKLPNGASSTLNAVDNAVTLNQGVRQTLGTAKTEGLGVADELAKFFKGTGATDVGSVDSWKDQLSTNASPADVKGLTQGAINLLAGQLDVLNQQYQQTMGKSAGSTFLQPATVAKLSNLKNQGYQVDIPGVNYTDKDAFMKYGGGTQDQLNAAYTQLKNAGLPATPENILHAAQL